MEVCTMSNNKSTQSSQQPPEPKYPTNAVGVTILVIASINFMIFCPTISFPLNIVFSLVSTLFISLFIFPFIKHSYDKQVSNYKYWKNNPQEYQQYLKEQCLEKEEKLQSKTVVYANAATPTIECPYCHSTNTHKLSTISRGTSTLMFGLASGKIGKQWHCDNCNSDF